jgi:hypothetical protein
MMDDAELDALLEGVAERDRHHSEAMVPALWRELERRHPSRWRKALIPVLAAAAALVVGVGIGRWTGREQPMAPISVAEVAIAPGWAPTYTDLRGRAHGLLADVVNADLGSADRWRPLATELLWATRRLLDSPVAAQSDQLRLLGQLELVLAELLGVDPTDGAFDLELLRETLRNSDELMRSLSVDREESAT